MIWKKINEKLIKDGWRKVCLKTFVLPDGTSRDFEIKKENDSVCILAVTVNNKIVLAKQFRAGPEKVLLELPGGALEEGEKKEEAARRELLEETGYTGDIKFVNSSPADGWSTRITHSFVATNCFREEAQKLDSTEFIEVMEMSLGDFREHLRGGQLTDTRTGYLGLDFLNLL